MLRCSVLNLEFGESYSECRVQLWYSGFSRPALIQLYSGLLCSDSVLKSTDKIIQIYTQVPQVPTSTCKYPKVPERYNFTWAQLWSDKTLLGTARPLSTVTTIQQQICTPRRQHLHFHPVKNYLLTMNMVRKYHHSAANLHTTPPPANLFISSFPSNEKISVCTFHSEQIWWGNTTIQQQIQPFSYLHFHPIKKKQFSGKICTPCCQQTSSYLHFYLKSTKFTFSQNQ